MNKGTMKNQDDLIGIDIDHDSPIPLHSQVEQILRDMIKDPKYQKGKFLPKEMDMAKRWGISRNTIRQATSKLIHEDLLIRKKGVGTTVSKKAISTKLKNWFSFSQEMEDSGIKFINYSVKSKWITASSTVAAILQIKAGRKILKLTRLRGLKDGPFVHFISYFHPRIGLTGEEDFSRHLYEIIEKDHACVPSISKEEIQAILADKSIATYLQISTGDPVLFRKRIVCDPGNRPLEYNLGYYNAKKFSYTIDIKR